MLAVITLGFTQNLFANVKFFKMKNEKVDLSNLVDFGAALVFVRLVRARVNFLDRKRRKLDSDDEAGLMEISYEISTLEKLQALITELALINSKQMIYGLEKKSTPGE